MISIKINIQNRQNKETMHNTTDVDLAIEREVEHNFGRRALWLKNEKRSTKTKEYGYVAMLKDGKYANTDGMYIDIITENT